MKADWRLLGSTEDCRKISIHKIEVTRLPISLADSEPITALLSGTSTIFLPWKSSAKLNFGLACPSIALSCGRSKNWRNLFKIGFNIWWRWASLNNSNQDQKLSKPIGSVRFFNSLFLKCLLVKRLGNITKELFGIRAKVKKACDRISKE